MQISADAVAPGSSAKAVQGASWQKYVARCATGDQAALAALYDESSRLVYSLILMIVRNPADAEEVTLDVNTTVWNSALRYDDSRGGVFGWLSCWREAALSIGFAPGHGVNSGRTARTFSRAWLPGFRRRGKLRLPSSADSYWRRWKPSRQRNAGCCDWPSLTGIRTGNWPSFCNSHSAR